MKMKVLMGQLVLAIALSVGLASVAEARAGHNQPGPEAFEANQPVERGAASTECYVEPDGACVAARAKQREAARGAATAGPDCYVEPVGVHHQLRSDGACVAARAKYSGN